mmetsp:Transcript_36723/g.73595  ORF Transcript_36723/g.73595 Transcript_36723/m.73595 type:complete len:252 (+) Transcript_36723:148-903(+)
MFRNATNRQFSTPSAPGFFELRQYVIRPGSMKPYMTETFAAAGVRKALFDTQDSRWLSFFSTEIGGSLTSVHHLYWYKDYDVRDKVRAKAASSLEWGAYLKEVRPLMDSQKNCALIEATSTLQAAGLPGALSFAAPDDSCTAVAYELRRYQLKLGYNTVPDFLKLYGEGLPDKLRVDDSGASTLVTLLYSDSGPLNVVYEVWRHESLQRSLAARQASRQSSKWKEAVGSIALLAETFDTQFLRPTPFSPWQ